jgi:Zn-dependent M16 (insulinase) family peptidase
MHELFLDPFAAHVYQAILHTLNGHPQKNLTEPHASKKRKKKEGDISYSCPSSFEDLRTKLIDTVKQWDPAVLQSLVLDKYAVPLMQTIIESDVPKKSKKMSKKHKTSRHTVAALLLNGKDAESEGFSTLNVAKIRTTRIR